MMIELNVTGAPIQQRTDIQQDTRVNPITNDEKPAQTNQSDTQWLKQGELKKEKVQEIVKSLNDFLQPAHTSLIFKFHEKLNEYYVTIVDDNTNQVIKEIPPKKLLDTYAAMAERLGFLVDRKV